MNRKRCRCRNTHSHNGSFSFPRPTPEFHTRLFYQRGFLEQLFQKASFLLWEPLIFEPERLAEYLRELLNPVPRRLHGLLDFFYQFIGGRGIRRTFAVIFMRFAYIVENDIPCFVRHMAEEIFFLYLTGFQYFACPVCRSFGMFFQYHSL